MFFALLILFFVIFLLTPLSALSRDFVSYSLVVTCNYVITSTSILFKALFYSKVVNYWRRSLTEMFLLHFLYFLRQKLSILAFFFNSLRLCLLWWWCTFVGLRVLVTFMYIYIIHWTNFRRNLKCVGWRACQLVQYAIYTCNTSILQIQILFCNSHQDKVIFLPYFTGSTSIIFDNHCYSLIEVHVQLGVSKKCNKRIISDLIIDLHKYFSTFTA